MQRYLNIVASQKSLLSSKYFSIISGNNKWLRMLCGGTARLVVGLNPHQCLWIHGLKAPGWKRLVCHAGYQKVSRCGTRGESEHTGNKAHKRVIYSGFKTQSCISLPKKKTYLCLPKKLKKSSGFKGYWK